MVGWDSVFGVASRYLGVALTTHSHLAPSLKKEWSYTSTRPLGLLYGELYFIFLMTD
jgi:hypothetical protein